MSVEYSSRRNNLVVSVTALTLNEFIVNTLTGGIVPECGTRLKSETSTTYEKYFHVHCTPLCNQHLCITHNGKGSLLLLLLLLLAKLEFCYIILNNM